MNYGMALNIFTHIICSLVSIAHSLVSDVFSNVVPGVHHTTPKNPCWNFMYNIVMVSWPHYMVSICFYSLSIHIMSLISSSEMIKVMFLLISFPNIFLIYLNLHYVLLILIYSYINSNGSYRKSKWVQWITWLMHNRFHLGCHNLAQSSS